ncbi:hypothetical protein A8135_14315 [Legionella jamestowniensis]|uniref:L,D-TPase catalytic domain-containing protein n=1 Tax=Legionella jamestowniensis TaxID=455 RepID=A0ABX2XSP0_9GAMM|nr:L,D-transpeptidase family protein [Legionella jamestowniensis]OCH97498.1 hypothetical protein A8135_14315 [Legionella jamestowniensis]
MKRVFLLLLILGLMANVWAETADKPFSENILQLQIYLDQKHFSPGKIDGIQGKFTQQALKYYKDANPNVTDQALKQSLKNISPLFTNYKITTDDKNFIGEVPQTPKEQSKKKKLPYRSYAEFVAERFHVDSDFLAKINPEKDLGKLKPGDMLKVPNIEPFRIEIIKEGKNAEKKAYFSNRSIKINTKERMLKLYEDGQLLAVFPITPGSEHLPAPKGTWKLMSITYLPWFRYDKKMLTKGRRSDNYYQLPPGPNSPVGVVWIALNKKGIGIHGTDKPDTIGRSASHGCIRLSNWDAITLSKMVTPGIKVEID